MTGEKLYGIRKGIPVFDKIELRTIAKLFKDKKAIAEKFHGEVTFVFREGGVISVDIKRHIKS